MLAPTRELAQQIHAECAKFGPAAGLSGPSGSTTVVYGGVPLSAQVKELSANKPAVVVATPGRLCDLLTRGDLSLGCANIVVLDEADRMLDMGFEKQIAQVSRREIKRKKRALLLYHKRLHRHLQNHHHRWSTIINTISMLLTDNVDFILFLVHVQVFAALPAERQTLFFTATWPKAVRKLAASYLRPEASGCVKRVFVGASEDAELEANTSITQSFVHATDDEKVRSREET